MNSEHNSSVSSSQQENRKLSEDEDVKMRKGVKTSQRLAQTQTGFSSPNLCPPAGTVRHNDRDVGGSFSWGGVRTAWQIIITSSPDRKFSDETRSVCLF